MAAIGWQGWALLSAVFAALTAILATVGVEGVDPDVATFVRTLVIAVVLQPVACDRAQDRRHSRESLSVPDPVGPRARHGYAISAPSASAMLLKSLHSTNLAWCWWQSLP